MDLLFPFLFDDEGVVTTTSTSQKETESLILKFHRNYGKSLDSYLCLRRDVRLARKEHIMYLLGGLSSLSEGFSCLDASQPWLVYWMLHSLSLLDAMPSGSLDYIVDFLCGCWDEKRGGFAGGPYQIAHLAPTYAATMSIVTIGGEKGLKFLYSKRVELARFLLSLQGQDGSFVMHEGGESDTRGIYCAAVVASILQLRHVDDRLFVGSQTFLQRCQTYEGGMCGFPGAEAHGGYTYCGIAAYILIKQMEWQELEVKEAHARVQQERQMGLRILRWATARQCPLEGGFDGRTLKLVDGCYSFWVGALFHLLPLLADGISWKGTTLQEEWACDRRWKRKNMNMNMNGNDEGITEEEEGEGEGEGKEPEDEGWHSTLIDNMALQEYILCQAQDRRGGLRDKPGKSRDFYHTCYCLSGLSLSQWCGVAADSQRAIPTEVQPLCFGNAAINTVCRTNVLYNVRADQVEKSLAILQSLSQA
jgi:protein farnesyltransferase subunit beta